MSDDLKELREQFDADMDDWSEARTARATDMRNMAGDPWSDDDKEARERAGRPYITCDELSQFTNQIVNDMRVNPLSVSFAPGPPLLAGQAQVQASEEMADILSDKMREIEYRSYAHEAYAVAFQNCVEGSYGYVRLVSEFLPDEVERQELRIKAVHDPNTVLPAWATQSPDLSDMTRCFVMEKRSISEFKRQFPKAKQQDFEGFAKDKNYAGWVDDKSIRLAEYWCIHQELDPLILVQPPAAQPPGGMMGLRPAVEPPPFTIRKADWPKMPAGYKVIGERPDATRPKVVQQLVNGVEILSETTWPGRYIPIAGCLGLILYLDEGGTSQRKIMSSIRRALGPFMSYCFYRTCEIEAVGQITKNPYWAYEGQVSPEQQQEIAKSIHEPVAVLFAKATTPATGQAVLPLPQRNPQSADIQGFSIGAEEMRRAIQAAMGANFLPTTAQKANEKSGVALESIRQSANRGTFHFFDHYKAMRRHMAVLVAEAAPTFYDTKQELMVRRRDETHERIVINDPTKPETMLKGSFTVEVSDGPNVDSTREAASDFADMLLGSKDLMMLLGPEKANKIAALAVKLKVKQTGIGAIGDEIVDIIDPPQEEGQQPDPRLAQAMQHIQELTGILQRAAQEKQAKVVENQGKFAIAQMQEQAESQRAALDRETKLAVAELGAKVDRLTLFLEERARVGAQQHEMGLAAADAAHEKDLATRDTLQALAQPAAGGAGPIEAQP